MNGRARKVILIELNEITWRIVRPLVDAGKLPTFAKFIEEGAIGSPVALEEPPLLDPWISWMTLYTGRPQNEHGVEFLEQPPETVRGPKIWDLLADAGKSLGLFGSIMSWPPRTDIKGFWVPSTFSPDSQTHPAELEPIQQLNLSATRAHAPAGNEERKLSTFELGWKLRGLGLSVSSVAQVLRYFANRYIRPQRGWEKVSLQPVINFDFFNHLYSKHKPDFATFHSNHVAHYQHRYWRAMDPSPFPKPPSEDEKSRFGECIEYGYRVADQLLADMWKLADDDTVVMVASGLGQKPQVSETFTDGKPIVRIRDIDDFLTLCGMNGKCEPLSMMAPQWILKFDNPEEQKKMERILDTAWYREEGTKLFSYGVVGDCINFNFFQNNLTPLELSATCCLPEVNGQKTQLQELCRVEDPTPKTGMHEQEGLLIIRGAGVKKGQQIGACNNLDFVPTILALLGVSQPENLKGKIMHDAFDSLHALEESPATA